MELVLLDREMLVNRNLLLCLTSFPCKPAFRVPGSGLAGYGPCLLGTPTSPDYPFKPVVAIPSMNCRWARKYRINTGSMLMLAAAIHK
jgi:hypothetical protein